MFYVLYLVYTFKYWNDKHSKVKRKKADKVRSFRETGGGKDETLELTEEEERIVSLIGGDIVIQGDSGVKELGFGPTEMEASTCLDFWQSSPVVSSTHFNYNQCLCDLYYKNAHNSMLFVLIGR